MPTLNSDITQEVVAHSVGDRDLVKRDWEDLQQQCFHQHCKRVWLKLSPQLRDTIREQIRKEESPLFARDSVLDYSCLREISRIITDAACFPFEGSPQAKDATRD